MFLQLCTFTEQESDQIQDQLLQFGVITSNESEDWNGVNYPYLTPDFYTWFEFETKVSEQEIALFIQSMSPTTLVVLNDIRFPPINGLTELEYRKKMGSDFDEIVASHREKLSYRRKYTTARKVGDIIENIWLKKHELWQEAVKSEAFLKTDYMACLKLNARYTALCQAEKRAVAFWDFLTYPKSRFYWFYAINHHEPFREIISFG